MNHAMITPSIRVPASPRNIRLLFPNTLWAIKGIAEAEREKARTAFGISLTFRNSKPNKRLYRTHRLLHKPFTPSMRLTALIIPTQAKTVNGTAIHQVKSPMPHMPWKLSMQAPLAKIRARRVNISTTNLALGVNPRMSSKAPV